MSTTDVQQPTERSEEKRKLPSVEDLKRLPLPTLQRMCNRLKIRPVGSRDELIARLVKYGLARKQTPDTDRQPPDRAEGDPASSAPAAESSPRRQISNAAQILALHRLKRRRIGVEPGEQQREEAPTTTTDESAAIGEGGSIAEEAEKSEGDEQDLPTDTDIEKSVFNLPKRAETFSSVDEFFKTNEMMDNEMSGIDEWMDSVEQYDPETSNFRSGYVSIIGTPNVGKSTLMNAYLQEKLSIVSPKPQTTRHRIMGMLTSEEHEGQIIYSDTPGLLKPIYRMHEGMMGFARSAVKDADVVLLVTDIFQSPDTFPSEDIFQRLQHTHKPIVVAINKIDLLPNTTTHASAPPPPSPPQDASLLPAPSTSAPASPSETLELQRYKLERQQQHPMDPWPAGTREAAKSVPPLEHQIAAWRSVLPNATIFGVSALERKGLEPLLKAMIGTLPKGPPLYPPNQVSDRSERFFAAEVIREKILLQYRKEVPYSCEVVVRSFKETDQQINVEADICVMRASQKPIILGHKGSAIKELGIAARKDLSEMFGKRVFLRLTVKEAKNWREDEARLREYGYFSDYVPTAL
ncbi:unnamed protein product [Vitrella brassicaformis CCMP3155]|uniref:SAP domain-containing protein n=1 Tax=Vitrella brassicaformis (strain CCMP3155) TaxID=1169540 RepID=A0A0G4F7B7_VITBC|nr:unnamed protein product [Vitrella brassicaformis CCMP3155]|eukprot:CEM08005.1 unnamed protein product [Vitrella brassicaformis CCMP3155]